MKKVWVGMVCLPEALAASGGVAAAMTFSEPVLDHLAKAIRRDAQYNTHPLFVMTSFQATLRSLRGNVY